MKFRSILTIILSAMVSSESLPNSFSDRLLGKVVSSHEGGIYEFEPDIGSRVFITFDRIFIEDEARFQELTFGKELVCEAISHEWEDFGRKWEDFGRKFGSAEGRFVFEYRCWFFQPKISTLTVSEVAVNSGIAKWSN